MIELYYSFETLEERSYVIGRFRLLQFNEQDQNFLKQFPEEVGWKCHLNITMNFNLII